MKRALLGAWDALVLLLFVLPLAMGGIWLHRPGLKIELAEMSVPVILLALVAAALRAAGVRVAESRSARALEWLARRWREQLAHRPGRTLTLGVLGVGALWSLAALRRHWALESHAFDLGIFTNGIWNLVSGNGYLSSVKNDLPLFADHQSPLFWVLAPLFALAPRAETLLVAQGFGLAAGAAALYAIGRQYSPRGPAPLLLPLAYWLYSPIRSANLFDFHPEVFMLPLFLAAIAGLQSARPRARVGGLVALALALGAKESAGPVAAGIGLAWALGAGPAATRELTRRLGWLVGAAGVLTFAWDIFMVPRLLGTQYAYQSLYAHLDGPLAALRTMLDQTRLKFLLACLLPLAFLPFLGGPALVAALPGFLMLFLQSSEHKISAQYHYGIEPAVGLLWALAVALARVRNPKAWRLALALCLLLTFGRSSVHYARFFAADAHRAWLRDEIAARIPPELAVAASGPLVPQLAARRWVSNLPVLDRPSGAVVDCVVFDSRLDLWPMHPAEVQALLTRLKQWTPIYTCGSTQIWQSPALAAPARCLPVDVNECVIS